MGEDGTTLLIRTGQGAEILELVPCHKLAGDLPRLLVENYTHWLNLSNGEVELRSIENPWKSSTENWRIQFSSNGDSRMQKGPSFLVDIQSPTFEMISSILLPLEHAEYQTITYSLDDQMLSVHLPRFRLSFFLNSRDLLESRNWPGMVIDSNQSTGTMFGLSSQLVLRAEHRLAPELPPSRRVLIPQGKPLFKPKDSHVSIAVDTTLGSNIKYYEYKVDTDLGCLTSNTLASRLFKVLLHGISSYCLPDPLTGRTGTEEALHELGSASCQSFQKLGDIEVDLLRQISSLTPHRVFYPVHKEVMQTVNWSDLASLTQHHGFYAITQSIAKYTELLAVFQVQSQTEVRGSDSDNWSSSHLLERAARRNAAFYPEELADPLMLTHADALHMSRDLPSMGKNISNISAMVRNWPRRLTTSRHLFDIFKGWGILSAPDHEVSLSYSRHWLALDLAGTWMSLYNLCRGSSSDERYFQLAFSLSAMAFSCSAENQTLIPTILAFATISYFRTLNPPTWTFYDLSRGLEPQRQELRQIVLSFAVSFEDSPESTLPRNHREDEVALGQRRYAAFEARRDSQAKEIVDALTSQWPCKQPRSPSMASDGGSWLFDVQGIMAQVKSCFQVWYQNKELRDHIQDVQVVLDEAYLSNVPAQSLVHGFTPCSKGYPSASSAIAFGRLLERDVPDIVQPPCMFGTLKFPNVHRNPSTTNDLQSLLSEFQCSSSTLCQLYGQGLDKSRRSLDSGIMHASAPDRLPYSVEVFANHRAQCSEYLQNILASIHLSLSPSDILESTMFTAGHWPRVTTRSLLGKLAFNSETDLTSQWRAVLITLAQALLLFQRSQRLLVLAYNLNYDELFRELENKGYDFQDSVHNPDWLLIQVNPVISLERALVLNPFNTVGTKFSHSTPPTEGCA
jgi:hypothetical protein